MIQEGTIVSKIHTAGNYKNMPSLMSRVDAKREYIFSKCPLGYIVKSRMCLILCILFSQSNIMKEELIKFNCIVQESLLV